MSINDTFSNLGTAIINFVNSKLSPATSSKLGLVKPDGDTITVDANGVISSTAEGGSGFDMFDVVQKDHILTYEDTEGFAPLGSYVYKEAVVGERYGYPDFYDTCVAEYNDANNIVEHEYVKSNVTHIGDVIDNNGVLSNFSASNYVRANTTFSPSTNAWEFKTKLYINSVGTTQYIINTGSGAGSTYRELFGIESSKFAIWVSSNNSSWNIASSSKGSYTPVANTWVYIKFGWTGSIYYVDYSLDDITYTRDISVSSTTAVYSNNEYPNFGYGWSSSPSLSSIDLKETSISINSDIIWSGADVLTYRHNANGHSFYDIAHKALVDEDYEEHEHAWFYGVDTTNKRIFLPRRRHGELLKAHNSGTEEVNSWYRIYQDGWCEQGGTFSWSGAWTTFEFEHPFIDTNYTITASGYRTDADPYQGYVNTRNWTTHSFSIWFSDDITSNPSKIKWSASGFIDRPAQDSYDYMCVGNKKQNTAWINIVEQVEDGVADIEAAKIAAIGDLDDEKVGIMNEIGGVTHFVARSIGEMVESKVPLNEAGLHPLDGELLDGSGVYAQFVSHMRNLYNNKTWRTVEMPMFYSNSQDGIIISDARGNTDVLRKIMNGEGDANVIGAWSTYWINVDFERETKLVSYTIQADAQGDVEYPSAWTLQGSEDGDVWETIDSQSGQTFTSGEEKTFELDLTDTYEEYRIVFSNGVQTSDGNGELQHFTLHVQELVAPEMFIEPYEEIVHWANPVISANNTPFEDDFAVYSTDSSASTLYHMFDNDATTEFIPNGKSLYVHVLFKEPINVKHVRVTGGSTGLTCDNATCSILRDGAEAHYTDRSYYTQVSSENNVVLNNGENHYAPINEHNTIYTKGLLIHLTNVTAGSAISEIHISGLKEGTKHTALQIWEEIVGRYGFCDKFAYDEDSNAIRLPLHTDNSTGKHLIDTYHNGYNWYRVYDDGWCEQGGLTSTLGSNVNTTITLHKPMEGKNYNIVTTERYDGGTSDSNNENYWVTAVSPTNFAIYNSASGYKQVYWTVKGYTNIGDYAHQELNPYKYIVVAQSAKTELQVDLDNVTVELSNMIRKSDLTEIKSVVETFSSGNSWYRIYSDGWCEQGGRVSASSQTVYYLKPFKSTNYTVTGGLIPGTTSATYEHFNIGSLTTSSFYYTAYDSYQLMWQACGYIS